MRLYKNLETKTTIELHNLIDDTATNQYLSKEEIIANINNINAEIASRNPDIGKCIKLIQDSSPELDEG